MNKTTALITAFFLSATAVGFASTSGCELVASVDRSLINADGGTGGTGGMTTSSSTSSTSTSSTSTSSTSTSSTVECGDGGSMCTMDTDCHTGVTTKCVVAKCTTDCCAISNATSGAGCNDNGGSVCDGNGACVPCVKDSDCGTDTTCQSFSCNTTTHTCNTPTNTPKGTTCTGDAGAGEVCDGNGSCSAAHCTDGMKDSDESDTDCGGSCATKCADFEKCNSGSDCANKVCTGADSGTEGTCAAPTCGDHVQNGNETDVDCGGNAFVETADGGADAGSAACPPCADTLKCGGNTDCVSINCVSNVCTAKALGVTCTATAECGTGNACVPDDNSPTSNICCATSCADTTSTACGTNGNCKHDGSACADWSSSTLCVTASCNVKVLTKTTDCNGTGTCPTAATVDCGATSLVCNAGKNACVQCNAGGDCNAASCSVNGSSNIFTPAQTCNGSNNCVGGTAVTCSGSTSKCDTTNGCVQCNTGTDCTGASCSGNNYIPQTCNASGACVAGTQQACSGTTPVCNAGKGCVQCNSVNDCAMAACTDSTHFQRAGTCTNNTCNNPALLNCGASNQVCNLAAGGCVQCNADADCAGTPTTPVCDTTTNNCVQCTASKHTACSGTTPVCNTLTETCAKCSTDTQCSGSTPACFTSGACTQCSATNATLCSAASCSGVNNTIFTPAQTCGGAGTCTSGSSTDCSASSSNKACLVTVGCGCNSDTDCGGTKPYCNTKTNACGNCVPTGGTVGDTSLCGTDCCNTSCSGGTTCN